MSEGYVHIQQLTSTVNKKKIAKICNICTSIKDDTIFWYNIVVAFVFIVKKTR